MMSELLVTLVEVSAAFALLISVGAYLNSQKKNEDEPQAIRVPVRAERKERRR
jgi:hypothetical protein